jgi:hypothetical protein
MKRLSRKRNKDEVDETRDDEDRNQITFGLILFSSRP